MGAVGREEGRGGMSAGDEVTIGGRVFTLGTVYAPRRGRGRKGGRKPRRLLEYTCAGTFPEGGEVMVEMVSSGVPYVMAGAVWAAWAGEPVGGVGR
jgi:hypothetical protein